MRISICLALACALLTTLSLNSFRAQHRPPPLSVSAALAGAGELSEVVIPGRDLLVANPESIHPAL